MPEHKNKAPVNDSQADLGTEHMEEHDVADTPTLEGAASISPAIIIPPVTIAIVMSFLLAIVFSITETPIVEAKNADKRDKLGAVMPKFDNDPLEFEQVLTDIPAGKAGNVMQYTGLIEEEISGFGITSAVGTGYSGYFSVVFGFDSTGNVIMVKILESTETPGLGSKVRLPDFIDQFTGKNPNSFNFSLIKDGGDIQAVTGATITSRAVCDAVTQGMSEFVTPHDDGIQSSKEVSE